MNRFHVVLGSALAITTIAATRLGGWAVVTVENPPDYLVAGNATELTFTVRQHGMTLLSDLRPRIEASAAGRRVTGSAWQILQPGTYRGTITVPDTGTWQITVQSGFGRSKGTLLPLRAVDSPLHAPPPLAPPERGRRLFAAKGCVTCHVHGGVEIVGELQMAPDLTERRFPADYLAKFLANPSIKTPTMDLRMPNLGLKQAEIASLVAFINSERKLSSR
jgi:mono/diheme cytochrome c family protein